MPKFYQKSGIRFLILVIVQLSVFLATILTFQQSFQLSALVIPAHLCSVVIIFLLTVVFSLIVTSFKILINSGIARYAVSLSWGCANVALYFTYVLSFIGKRFNDRIFSFEIFLGYVKNLHDFIENIGANPLLIYGGLFLLPGIILACTIAINKLVFNGILQIRNGLFNMDTGTLKIQFKTKTIVTFLLVGTITSLIWYHFSKIYHTFYKMEEPVVSVFFNQPIQGQYLSYDQMDFKVRKAYPKNISFRKKNVITIIVDDLRADHLSLFGYFRKTTPFLDSLYKKGDLHKIDLSFSSAAASFAGINGILRSRIWSHMGYSNFSLQQLLKDQGYTINFLISDDHTHFFGLKSYYGKPSEIDFYLDGSGTTDFASNDDRIIFEGLNKIGDFHNNPSYFHIHLNSAHRLGKKFVEFRVYKPCNPLGKNKEEIINAYDNGIVQADNFLKKIFQEFEKKGYLQNSIVVITADHGESLGEHGYFGHSKNVYTEELLIPIIFYDPEHADYSCTTLASSLDIAPTIVDRLTLPVPAIWEGTSLLKETNRAYTFHQMKEYYAVIHPVGGQIFQYVYNSKTKKEELFELRSDLYGHNNLIDHADKLLLDSLRNQLVVFHIDP